MWSSVKYPPGVTRPAQPTKRCTAECSRSEAHDYALAHYDMACDQDPRFLPPAASSYPRKRHPCPGLRRLSFRLSVAATLRAWRGRGDGRGGEGDETFGSLHGRPGVGWPDRGGFILGSGLHREQSAQLPGGKLAVLAGGLEMSGGLGVLTSPDSAGADGGDGVGGQDAGVDGVANCRGVVGQL